MSGGGFPDLRVVSQFYKSQLVHLLEICPGPKDLILDPNVMKLLDHIGGMTTLR